MKTLLVPFEAHELMQSVLQTALLAGRRFQGYIEGFALRPAIPEYVPIDMVSGLTWQADEKADEEAVRAASASFHAFMQQNGVPAKGEGAEELGFGWLDAAPPGDTFLSSYGRVFDAIVLGRPMAGQAVPSMATLEAALFESGRPILIAPPATPASLGDKVVIAWNGSTETARTVAFAMPFLKAAGSIVVMSVEGWNLSGPPGEQLALSLRRNGISAEHVVVAPERRSPGEAVLARAAAMGADLVVKGAYTQSRLRQMIFGGATSHILSFATVPVFMAH